MKHYVFGPDSSPEPSARELQAAREIAQAFLSAESPAEVYHLALERVTPLVGAAFSCLFLREGEGELLHVVAAHNWPETYRAYLSEMRVRIGLGPTGRAVAEHGIVEVPDVFADESLSDWWESARELGFVASISLPLLLGEEPSGAVTFYFRGPEVLSEADRSLLQLVADQLAAVVEKTHLIDDLQLANARLRAQNLELELRYREAEEARRLKTEFLANVSHELRTPLTAILGYTYLLREGLSGELNADQAGSVEKVENAATMLLRLINDLLDLSNLRIGRTRFEPQIYDAVALTSTALSGVTLAPGVELRTELPSEPLPVYTDATHALRILTGLLANAAKFTERGTITVRLWRADLPGDERDAPHAKSIAPPFVVWEVEDTGIGIAEEEQKHIFDEFRQVDGSATRRFGGTGLGLALSRGLAYHLGGDITLRSQPGQGSTFYLRLPTAESGVSQANDHGTPQPSENAP